MRFDMSRSLSKVFRRLQQPKWNWPGNGKFLAPLGNPTTKRGQLMTIIWTIIIGFVAGIIAKFLMPGKNEPSGFILTTILGIVGAFVATWLGQALGWYGPDEGAG